MSEPAPKKRRTAESARTADPKVTDSRFTNIQSDPRYRLPGRREKIKVDKRFAKALQDEDFSRKAKVDRYGRPLETESAKQRLKRKYEFDEEEERSESESNEVDDDEVQAEISRVTDKRDVLREGKDISSSEDEGSSEEDSEDEEEQVDEVGPGVRDRDVPMGDVSSRLAVVNLDWDNIRAEDLMAVFQSFLPATGRLLKVAIYPSEFGKERIEREEMEGPPKEIFARKDEDSDLGSDAEEEDDDEAIKKSIIKPDDGSEFDSTALRQYQLDRLRYYYAVLTFTDARTAKAIYDSVDGAEYLSTANFFDLRFVPDGTDFSEDVPREECERMSSSYKPNEFVTDALQHSKVKLTWDADDTTRKEAQARAFRRGRHEIDQDDLKAYLASDTESEVEEDEAEVADSALSKKDAERQRMRALLGLAPEPVKQTTKGKKDKQMGNIQITFSAGLSGAANEDDLSTSDEDTTAKSKKSKKKHSVFANSPEPEETTMEKYVRKEKERKQRRKEKMKANRDGTTDAITTNDNAQDASADEDNLGFDDPFFSAPTHDAKSASKERKADRLARRAEREAEEAANAKQRAALEKLMADDDDDNNARSSANKGRTVRHFDMNEIEKAEKALAKKQLKGKKAKASKKTRGVDHEAVLAGDDFEINTTDPRFAGLYENHEFAIDPMNPRFKGTKGMKALLDEGRKRKEKDGGKEKAEISGTRGDRERKQQDSSRDEVTSLVDKIKRRNK